METDTSRYLHSNNPGVNTACRDCGAGMIHDTEKHNEFHDRIDRIERDAQAARNMAEGATVRLR